MRLDRSKAADMTFEGFVDKKWTRDGLVASHLNEETLLSLLSSHDPAKAAET